MHTAGVMDGQMMYMRMRGSEEVREDEIFNFLLIF